MAEFPAMPFWTDAYLGDTTHLTTVEHGAYLLLLITMWRTPDQTLPNDDKQLARYCRATTRQWQKLKPVIMPFFTVTGDRITQKRLQKNALEVKKRSHSAAKNAKAMWRKKKETSEAGASDPHKRIASGSDANQNHITTNIPSSSGTNGKDRAKANGSPALDTISIRALYSELLASHGHGARPSPPTANEIKAASGWIDAGVDEAILRRVFDDGIRWKIDHGQKPPMSLAWYDDRVLAEIAERKKSTAEINPWPDRIRQFRRHGAQGWHPMWGPPPGARGYLGPPLTDDS